MTHVNIDLDKINWAPVFESQMGRGRYFEGAQNQRGFGLLQSVGKFLLPVLRNFAMSAGEEGVQSGMNILKDLTQGKDLKETVKTHGLERLNRIASKVHQ